MYQCGRLTHAENVYAYYVASEKQVVVAADVWLNPYTDSAHICPNPIAMPAGAREFLVEVVARTGGGVHPMIVVKERVFFSFPSDATPKSVVVYSMGVDAPSRQEVPLGAPPPPLVATGAPAGTPATAAATASPSPTAPKGPVELTGFSATFSFEEALHDALTQALTRFPAPPRNPDVGVSVTVKDITARTGGNIRPGLFVKVTAV